MAKIVNLEDEQQKRRKVKRPTGPAPTVEEESNAAKKRRDRMVRFFVKRRGRAALNRFLDLCSENKSGQQIADEFGVTRQRVQQWRDAFGQTVHAYSIHSDILAMLGEKGEE